MIQFTLPFPPSVNTYWRMFRNRMIISAKGREYRKAVEQILADELIIVRHKPLRVEIEVFRPDRRKRDLDNLLKAPLDAMTYCKVWDDDSQIHELSIRWGDGIKGMLKIKITELDKDMEGTIQ